MTEVRPFTSADLPPVMALIESRLPGWVHGPSLLVDTLLEHPWADPELSSLVAVDSEERIVGFFGAQVRRMRLGERTVRGVCCSHLVVASDRGAGLAGTLLLRQMLSGPQDLSWTDSATDTVVRMWESFGGYIDCARTADWMLVLRPVRWICGVLGDAARQRRIGRGEVPVGALPLQVAGPRLLPRAFPTPSVEISGVSASASTIASVLPSLTRKVTLSVDYDAAHLETLFRQVRSALGVLVTRIVHRGTKPIGWYAYVSRPGGTSRVLHIGAQQTDADAVVGELIAHARADGCAVVSGRAEPHLRQALTRRFAVLGFARQPVVHTRDLEIRALISTDASLISHLDGEWFAT